MANDVSLSVELLNSVTSDSVNLYNFGMYASVSMCIPIELIPFLMDDKALDDK